MKFTPSFVKLILVTWQVKLFLSEDFPSIVGQKSQDHLQAKTSSMLHSSINEPNDLPPGFESSHFLNQLEMMFKKIYIQ